MKSDITYYPEWLGPRLIDDTFDWDSALEVSLEEFFDQYTLHDSYWIGFHLQLDQAGTGIAVIRFDAFWTDGRIPHPGSQVAEWPILLIRFTGITEVQLTGFGNPDRPSGIISGATSTGVAPDRHHTEVEDIFSGVVRIAHAPTVRILCLNRAGTTLPLPLPSTDAEPHGRSAE